MVPGLPTPRSIRIGALAVVPIALLATYFRLFLRFRKRMPWWDDLWAFVSSIGMLIFLAGILIFTDPPNSHSKAVSIAGYYMIDAGFYGVIWPARVSILCTVMRIASGRFRVMLKCAVVGFVFTHALLMAQVFWVCEGYSEWKEEVTPQCMLGQKVAIAQLITDVFSDILLIATPTYLLWRMNNRKSIKIRLIALFSTTILTTITSLVHAYAILKDLGPLELALCVLELSTSLVVVNLTVIVTWACKLKDDSSDVSTDIYTHANASVAASYRRRPGSSDGKASSHPSSNRPRSIFALSTFGVPGGIRVTVDTVRHGASESTLVLDKVRSEKVNGTPRCVRMAEEGRRPTAGRPGSRSSRSKFSADGNGDSEIDVDEKNLWDLAIYDDR